MTGFRLAVLLGILGGFLFTFSPGTLFVLLITFGVSLLIWGRVNREDRRFVFSLFLTGFLVRAVFSMGLDGLSFLAEKGIPAKSGPSTWEGPTVMDHTRRFMQMGDSDYYSERGWALAERAHGRIKRMPRYFREEYGRSGYLHVIGFFYYLFGFSPMAVKLLNVLLGALLVPLIYFIAKDCFHAGVARWAAWMVALFPSLVLWSTTNLKDPLLLFLTGLLILLLIRIRRPLLFRHRVFYIFWLTLFFFIHASLRSPLYSISLVGSFFLSTFLTSRLKLPWKLLLLLIALGGILHYGQRPMRASLEQAFSMHIGHVTTPGTVYKYLPEDFYLSREYLSAWFQKAGWDKNLLPWFGRANLHYYLEPFPWRVNDLFTSMTYPQMIFWYFCLPFALAGLFWTVLRNRARALFLVLFLVFWSFIGALTNGNIGTLFRLRDMVSPYVLLFTCVGLWNFLYGEVNEQRELKEIAGEQIDSHRLLGQTVRQDQLC